MARSRYFVPDLSPEGRKELRGMRPRVVFVAESPHSSEVAPECLAERRPFCGSAGKEWWSALGEAVGEKPSVDVTLSRMLLICSRHGIVILNAVQLPLESRIVGKFPEADPLKTLGFCKNRGPRSFWRLAETLPVRRAIRNLRKRIRSTALKNAPIYCLGGDAEWFVRQALGEEEFRKRVRLKIAHPSAWWQRRGRLRREARRALFAIFGRTGPRIGKRVRKRIRER